jgi:hypothetical protein
VTNTLLQSNGAMKVLVGLQIVAQTMLKVAERMEIEEVEGMPIKAKIGESRIEFVEYVSEK